MAEIRQMPNSEYVGWQIYFARKAQRAELERLKAESRGGAP